MADRPELDVNQVMEVMRKSARLEVENRIMINALRLKAPPDTVLAILGIELAPEDEKMNRKSAPKGTHTL